MKIAVKSLLLTIVTLTLTFLTSKLSETKVFKLVFPETVALEEFEITDVAFKNRKSPEINEQIVIVNTSTLGRSELADEIRIISKYNPRVIAIDDIFDCPGGLRHTVSCPQLRDTKGNESLMSAIENAGTVVLASRLLRSDSTLDSSYDSVRRSDPEFRPKFSVQGYTNVETEAAYQDGARTCRQFIPKLTINGRREYSLAVQIGMAYDSVITKRFLKRNNFSEIINYRGNLYELSGASDYPEAFYVLDVKDVMTENFIPEMLKDRVVIFGFVGETLMHPSWNDKYYTPLNKTVAGKATPDMFGVVIHANILSMILDQDYVDKLSELNEFVFAFFVCLLHIYILLIIKERIPRWFELLSLALIFVQLVFFSYLRIFSMQFFSFKLTLIVTLGSLAIASLSINIFSGLFENVVPRLTSLLKHKAQPVEKVIQ